MLIRMETGRLKVFKHLNDWFDECRLYYPKDGVHQEGYDLMSATRCAVMMLHDARTNILPKPRTYRPYAGAGGWMASEPVAAQWQAGGSPGCTRWGGLASGPQASIETWAET